MEGGKEWREMRTGNACLWSACSLVVLIFDRIVLCLKNYDTICHGFIADPLVVWQRMHWLQPMMSSEKRDILKEIKERKRNGKDCNM